MKKLVFKKWVQNLLLVIGVIALIISASEIEDLSSFIIIHGICGLILTLICVLLFKYGREYD